MVSMLALPEGGEWIVLLVIVVLLFGAKKLPELTRNTAKALVEFKKISNGQDDETPAKPTANSAAGPAQPATAAPPPQPGEEPRT
ncbi:twin-arginine translocase TatA/TatE family subunit [Kribbella sp.]|uniref:twin-arginine translocase TatA/TatE family subunit n=1 Tax=Kribbella sp. TaxID=1871183 RepID=UPI0039C9B24F